MSGSIRWAFCVSKWKPSKTEWISSLSCIQPEEQDRIMKFVFKRDAKSALIGRLLLRKVISEQLRIPFSEIKLARTDKGKPYLVDKNNTDFHFNVSHQGDYVVLAAELGIAVGVDIMKTEIKGNQPISDFFHTMRRQFTSYEWQTIRKQPSERKQLQMFLRHWCLKESYVKALGVGIGLLKKLQSIEFRITPHCTELSTKTITTDTKLFLESVRSEDWCFEECKLDDEHQVAVALRRSYNDEETRSQAALFTMLSINDLVQLCSLNIDESLWTEFESKKERPEEMQSFLLQEI